MSANDSNLTNDYDGFHQYNSSAVLRRRCNDKDKTYEVETEYVVAPIDSLGPPGRWIRHKLLESILYGTPVLVAIQQLRTKGLTRFMRFASMLGTEEFYAILVCFLTWVVDLRLGRLACIAMAIGFYVANAVKNGLCLPRPPSPPVVPLEDAYYTWGLPSHHSVLGVICPWYIWFYVLQHYHLQFTTLVCLFTLVSIWSFIVLFCRIYNGVHSPADVVTGSLFGIMIVAFMNRFDNMIDLSSVMNGQSALILPVWLALLLILHPFNDVGIPAFEETTSMASCAVGFILGRAFSHGKSPVLKSLLETYVHGESSILLTICFAFLRYLIGIVLVLIAKESTKLITQVIITTFCKLFQIKFITKSERSKYYTGYTDEYQLPPVYKNKRKAAGDDDVDDDDDDNTNKVLTEQQQLQESASTTTNSKQEIWNISHYTRFVSYISMGFVGYYCNTALCQYIGLVL